MWFLVSLILLLLHIYDHLPVPNGVKLFNDIKIMTTELNRQVLCLTVEEVNPHHVGPALSGHRRLTHGTCPGVLWVLWKEHSSYAISTFQSDIFRCLMWFCFKYNPNLSPNCAFVFKDCNLVTDNPLFAAGVFSFTLQVHQTHLLKGYRSLRFECIYLCVWVSRQSSRWL